MEQIKALAEAAFKARQPTFTFPAGPVPIDGPLRLFYNRKIGPLGNGGRLMVGGGCVPRALCRGRWLPLRRRRVHAGGACGWLAALLLAAPVATGWCPAGRCV